MVAEYAAADAPVLSDRETVAEFPSDASQANDSAEVGVGRRCLGRYSLAY